MKLAKLITTLSLLTFGLAWQTACQRTDAPSAEGTFASDVAFLQRHTDVVVLTKGDSTVAVVPAYQGRVMTSTYDRTGGPSFGWINRPVIEKGILPEAERAGTLEEHIYIFGGEERFWLGPEGGQYGLFFQTGSKFEFSDWKTPPAIDTDPFKLVDRSEDSVTFRHECELMNYSGASFKLEIDRAVRALGAADAASLLDLELAKDIQLAAYETDNRITNRGAEQWRPETGLLSIWILGMYNPSPETTVVIPFTPGPEAELGPKVNDSYFGEVPEDYLKVEDAVLYFRGDGTRRGKIGVSPQRSKGIAGSYDAKGRVLTIVTYNVQEAPNGFVNSMWEFQKEPYAGDVINSYNDGSPEPGAAPLGPFYELETSSPASALRPGETLTHVQQTYHFHGPEEALDPLARRLLGVGLNTIKSKF